jgi:NAD(P)-dependent dehydrogenase (short-subunit alcohol dehydrogenase family)
VDVVRFGPRATLSQEVDFGVRFIIVEPGAFRTNLFAPDAAYQLTEYAGTVGPTREYVRTGGGSQAGDPAKAAQAILTAVNSAAPPLRLVLGADAISGIDGRLNRLREELRQWDAIGRATAFTE